MKIKVKKHFGQHFLKDLNIIKKIISFITIHNKYLIEIGPGRGALTAHLSAKRKNFMAIEIDNELYKYLKKIFPDINILRADFIDINISDITREKIILVGNFPYNISSQILFKVLENKNQIDVVVCMLQEEVANRIASQPGNKNYGILSVLLQAYYNIEVLFSVNQKSFYPQPKVKSAVIKMTRNSRNVVDCNEMQFIDIVKAAFNQRRKMLRNSLSGFNFKLSAKFTDILNKRAEQLSVNEYIELTKSNFN